MLLTKTNAFRLFLMMTIAVIALLAGTEQLTTAVHMYKTRIQDPEIIRDYLKAHSIRKLQLGAGGNDAEGWLNTDIEPTVKEVNLAVTKVGKTSSKL